MISGAYIYRNYRPADLDGYARLLGQSAPLTMAGQCASPRGVRESLSQPHFAPERDLFLVEAGGQVVAFARVTPEPAIGRVVLECFVQPEHRRRGLAKGLLGGVLGRAGELGARTAHACVGQENTLARMALPRLGFRRVRRYLELRLELDRLPLPAPPHDHYRRRHLPPGAGAGLARLQNRCFAGTWGYHPNTAADIAHLLDSGPFSPEDIIMLYDKDRPVGYCWTLVNEAGKAGTGRIHMMGVDPDFRGARIGRTVLLTGLHHLKDRGMRVAELTVDSQNKSARALYRAIGFQAWTSSWWYEKGLD